MKLSPKTILNQMYHYLIFLPLRKLLYHILHCLYKLKSSFFQVLLSVPTQDQLVWFSHNLFKQTASKHIISLILCPLSSPTSFPPKKKQLKCWLKDIWLLLTSISLDFCHDEMNIIMVRVINVLWGLKEATIYGKCLAS